jgi:hypothetical protein
MARKKTPQDREWDEIFKSIVIVTEPPPKYIKQATIKTKNGRRYRLSGHEFCDIMEQERRQPPENTMVDSCRLVLDYRRIREDVDRFALGVVNKAGRKYARSREQNRVQQKLRNYQKKNSQQP